MVTFLAFEVGISNRAFKNKRYPIWLLLTPNNFRVCAQQKCLIREMLQNVPYFWNKKTRILFFHFSLLQCYLKMQIWFFYSISLYTALFLFLENSGLDTYWGSTLLTTTSKYIPIYHYYLVWMAKTETAVSVKWQILCDTLIPWQAAIPGAAPIMTTKTHPLPWPCLALISWIYL